ncbi:MAG: TonB-dependent receptor [Alphaproteobacteria bacterium]|nr:TonB-dependent receptor [Alphaproteobacteria bacterium]
MKSGSVVVFSAVAAFVLSGGQARAQFINYGALQDIFDEPVTTSATGTPQRASETAADMTIITADQIRQSGLRKIPEILNMYAAGLNLLQTGVNEYDVGIRGFQQPYSPRLLVLIDGRQVFNYDYSRTQWENLPINVDDIRQIEVVRGASSALFGSNATSGVVNIITYSPLYDTNNVANFTLGTQSSYQGDATVTQRIDRVGGVKVSTGGLTEHEFAGTATGPSDYAGAENPFHGYVNGSGYFKVSPTFIVGGEISASRKKGEEVLPDFTEHTTSTTTYSVRGGWQWASPFGTIKHDNYINQNILDYTGQFPNPYALLGAYGTDPQVVSTTNSLFVSRMEDLFDVGPSHTFRIAGEYRHKYITFKSNYYDTYEKPIINQDVFSLGGTWLWHIRDDLSWTNAAQYEVNQMDAMGGTLNDTVLFGSTQPYTKADFDRQFQTFAFNSGLVWTVTDKDTLRATYGRGIQDPSLINAGFFGNEYITSGAPPGYPRLVYQALGSPYIKPTIMNDYNLAYDRKVPEIFSKVHVAAYYKSSRDIIGDLTPTVTTGLDSHGELVTIMTQGQGNLGPAHGIGGELSIDGTFDGFRWDASYSYTYVHDSAAVKEHLAFNGSAPQHEIRGHVGKTIGKWELDGSTHYGSSTDVLRTTTPLSLPTIVHIDNYYTVGARVGYKIDDNFVVALSGSNLSNMRTKENPYTILERRLFLGVTMHF